MSFMKFSLTKGPRKLLWIKVISGFVLSVFFITRVHCTHLRHECSFVNSHLKITQIADEFYDLNYFPLQSDFYYYFYSEIILWFTYYFVHSWLIKAFMMQIVQSGAFGSAHPWNSSDLFPLADYKIHKLGP